MISRKALLLVGTIALICVLETALYHMFGAHTPEEVPQRFLTVAQARRYLAQHEDVLVIDMRTRREFAAGHTPEAINIPLYQIHRLAADLPSTRPVLLVDVASARAYQGYWTLRRLRPDIAEVYYVRGWLWADNFKNAPPAVSLP